MRFKPYFNSDAGANPPGGGTPPAATPPAATPPAATGGNPAPPPANQQPGADDAEKETKELQELWDRELELTDAEKARYETLKGKYNFTPLGPDGKELTPDQIKAYRETQTKVKAILAKDEASRTEEEKKFLEENTEVEDNTSVYDKVNEIRGVQYEIDYGDVDPTSPEGIAIREDHVAYQAAQEFEQEIADKYPRAYQFMMHLAGGGKEEDFFKPENQDWKKITLDQNSKGQQEKVIRDALKLKGISPAIIDASITHLKDSGQLYDAAKTELEALQALQQKQEAETVAKAKQAEQKKDEDLRTFSTAVETAIKKGFEGIVVPEKDKGPFLDFLAQQVDYHNGTIFRVKPIDSKDLAKELKVAYFEFKGGDLKGLVERTAATQNVQRIKNRITIKAAPKTAPEGKRFIPLSEL